MDNYGFQNHSLTKILKMQVNMMQALSTIEVLRMEKLCMELGMI